MKISQITIENFKSYRSKQSIKFSVDEEKLITVLEGQMGHGKSNLLNAFYWCIFDQYWDGDKNQLITKPDPNTVYLFNKGSIADHSHEGEQIEMTVEIEFFDGLGNRYCAVRNQTGYYSKDEWRLQRHSNFKLEKRSHQDGTTKSFEGDQAPTEIEKLFPTSLSNYFLFRGENRTELVKLQGKTSFQKALDELSKVAVFKRSVSHLSKVRDELRKELAEDADEEIKRQMEVALGRKDDAQEALKSHEATLTDLEIQEQRKKEEYEEYQDKIKQNESALKLKGKIDSEEKEIKFLDEQLDQLHKDRRKQLTRKWASLLIKDLIKKTQDRHQKAVNSGTYPPDIKTSVIKKILHDLRCVCGREISPQSEEYKLIERLKEANSYDHLIGEIESIMGNVERVNNLLDSYPTEIKDQSEKENNLQQKISEKYDLIEAYEKKIGGIKPLDELQNKQNTVQKEWSQTLIKIDQTKGWITLMEKEIKDIEAELVSYEKKIKKNELPAIKSKLAKKALKEAENLKRRYEVSIYEDLEKYTQKHWDDLVYDKLKYDRIKLDPDEMYFEVLDEDGKPTRAIMNTGHSILLVLSFISALTRIARETWKEEYPLVMDAPTSEIGDSAIRPVLTGFGKVFNQVILILKDGSIPNKLPESLQNKIGKRYWIAFDKNKQHSAVESKELVYE